MSAVEAVAALPGGGAFERAWRQVDGDPGALQSLAGQFKSGASGLQEVQAEVSAATGGVGAAWSGPAADAFAAYMGRFAQAGADVGEQLLQAVAQIQSAAAAVDQSRTKVTAIADQVLDEVTPLLRDAASGSIGAGIEAEALVAVGGTRAEEVATELSSRLEQAAQALRALFAAGGFTRLPPAGDGSYLPAHGGPIQWDAVPEANGSTAPAGAAGGGTGGGGGGSGYAGGSGGGGSSGGPPAALPTGDVKTWIDQAIALLEANGVPASELSPADINLIIQHESGGNPHAENLWDSNAAAGHPSKGLMQTIDSTFSAYALPGHTDIWNPVDNIVAGVRYALSRYGSMDNVPGVRAVHDGGHYVGY